MKTILLGDAASDSGSNGFSDACPLSQRERRPSLNVFHLPSRPNGVYIHPLCDVDNELHIRIIVVVGATRNLIMSVMLFHRDNHHRPSSTTYLDVLIGHANVVGIGL